MYNISENLYRMEDLMENQYYISELSIKKVRHLNNLKIPVSGDTRKHLILTGKNGSGKTSLLLELRKFLTSIQDNIFFERQTGWKKNLSDLKSALDISKDESQKVTYLNAIASTEQSIERYGGGIEISFSSSANLSQFFKQGEFILAHFGSERKTSIIKPNGVEKINDNPSYGFDKNASQIFIKYLVNLKTQQSYARNEGELEEAEKITEWFNKFENSLCELLEDSSIQLKYDYKNYNFQIIQDHREPYGFDELSDGYSAIINIITDLILRMEHNRSAFSGAIDYDIQGIVLIDEVETHLHLSLQKSILPFLTKFFPKIQFIVTTHSPFVLNSIDNAVIYDLEKKILIIDMSNYTYDAIVKGYFQVSSYSVELKEKLLLYKNMAFNNNLNDDERALRAELRNELSHISNDFSNELRLEFEQIELQRKHEHG